MRYEDEFQQAIMGSTLKTVELERKLKQKELTAAQARDSELDAIRKELEKLSSEAVSTDMFLSTVRKYTRAKKLTPRMVNELINNIEGYQTEKIDGGWVQKLTIHCNCVGALFIPEY